MWIDKRLFTCSRFSRLTKYYLSHNIARKAEVRIGPGVTRAEAAIWQMQRRILGQLRDQRVSCCRAQAVANGDK